MAGSGVVSHAGAVLLTETVRVSGLDQQLSAALARWRKPLAVHDPAKVVTDLAVMLALGGDCLADIALLRPQPGCSARSRRIRRCRGRSTRWPVMRPGCWPRSIPPGRRSGPVCGAGLVGRLPAPVPMPQARW